MSLRARFLLGAFALSFVLVGGFTFATIQYLEIIEENTYANQLRPEFERFVDEVENVGFEAALVPPAAEGYFVDAAAEENLPGQLRALAPGLHHEVAIGGREYNVGKHRIGERVLYLLHDLEHEPIELLEHRLRDIAGWVGVSGILTGIALSLWLSNVLMSPVVELERRLVRIEPGAERPALRDVKQPRELETIARAFDSVLDRFDEFSARERNFTRDASHELRTPLAVIQSSAQLLATGMEADSKEHERLARLRAAAGQMQALIDALLFLARDETVACQAPVSAAALLEEVVHLHTVAGSGAARPVHVRVVEDHLLDVPRGLFLCVAGNLIGNALEHARGAAIEVVLQGEHLAVADAGPGIDAELLPNVFDDGVRREASSGQGLGLDLVRRICKRLGWTLELTSEPGRGTRAELRMRAPDVRMQ